MNGRRGFTAAPIDRSSCSHFALLNYHELWSGVLEKQKFGSLDASTSRALTCGGVPRLIGAYARSSRLCCFCEVVLNFIRR